MGAVVVRENALRQLHGQDDAQHDGDGHLARHPAALHRQVELGASQIIGEPEDSGTGDQRENATKVATTGVAPQLRTKIR